MREHGRRSCAGRTEKRGSLRALSPLRLRLHRASRSSDGRPTGGATALRAPLDGAGAAAPCASPRASRPRLTAFCVSRGFARRVVRAVAREICVPFIEFLARQRRQLACGPGKPWRIRSESHAVPSLRAHHSRRLHRRRRPADRAPRRCGACADHSAADRRRRRETCGASAAPSAKPNACRRDAARAAPERTTRPAPGAATQPAASRPRSPRRRPGRRQRRERSNPNIPTSKSR